MLSCLNEKQFATLGYVEKFAKKQAIGTSAGLFVCTDSFWQVCAEDVICAEEFLSSFLPS